MLEGGESGPLVPWPQMPEETCDRAAGCRMGWRGAGAAEGVKVVRALTVCSRDGMLGLGRCRALPSAQTGQLKTRGVDSPVQR